MERFDAVTPYRLGKIWTNAEDVHFQITDSCLGFRKAFANVDFSSPREVPPSPVAISGDVIARLLISGANDCHSKHALLVLSVYAAGGKVWYKDFDDSDSNTDFDMHITWQSA